MRERYERITRLGDRGSRTLWRFAVKAAPVGLRSCGTQRRPMRIIHRAPGANDLP